MRTVAILFVNCSLPHRFLRSRPATCGTRRMAEQTQITARLFCRQQTAVSFARDMCWQEAHSPSVRETRTSGW